jgi:hypothetical protein
LSESAGIDACEKGFVTTRIAESPQKRGIKPAVISADGWLDALFLRGEIDYAVGNDHIYAPRNL